MYTDGWRSSSEYSQVVPARGAPPMMKSGSLNGRRRRRRQPEPPLDDVERAAARLVENAPQIFAEHADDDQLHAPEDENREHHRRPAVHARAEEQLVDDDIEAEQ